MVGLVQVVWGSVVIFPVTGFNVRVMSSAPGPAQPPSRGALPLPRFGGRGGRLEQAMADVARIDAFTLPLRAPLRPAHTPLHRPSPWLSAERSAVLRYRGREGPASHPPRHSQTAFTRVPVDTRLPSRNYFDSVATYDRQGVTL